jgi:hypothetical protein
MGRRIVGPPTGASHFLSGRSPRAQATGENRAAGPHSSLAAAVLASHLPLVGAATSGHTTSRSGQPARRGAVQPPRRELLGRSARSESVNYTEPLTVGSCAKDRVLGRTPGRLPAVNLILHAAVVGCLRALASAGVDRRQRSRPCCSPSLHRSPGRSPRRRAVGLAALFAPAVFALDREGSPRRLGCGGLRAPSPAAPKETGLVAFPGRSRGVGPLASGRRQHDRPERWPS